MSVLRIHDLEDGILSVDLDRILNLLSPRSTKARWTVSAVRAVHTEQEWFDATGDGGEALDALANKGLPLSGHELSEIAQRTVQVIWGEFTAALPDALHTPWITVRAIDSSFYEIITSDESVLKIVLSTFKDVRLAETPWTMLPLGDGTIAR